MKHRFGCTGYLLILVLVSLAIRFWLIVLPIIACLIAAKVYTAHRQAYRNITSLATLESLYALAPEHFEQYIGLMLERLGWTKVRWVGKPGDLGADVTAIDPQGRKTVVQAKRYLPGTAIGSVVVQTLIGSQTIRNADRSMLVTTGRFTASATALAQAMDVELVDGARLVRMSQRAKV